MSSNIELLKPRDFGEIINDTFIFIRQNFKPLLKYFFIFCGFFMLACMATAVLQQTKMVSTLSNINSNRYDLNQGPFAAFGLEFFLNMLFLWFEITAINVTILCYLTLYRIKGNIAPDTEEMWGYFKFYFFKIMGSTFFINYFNNGWLYVLLFTRNIPGVVFSLVPAIMVTENTSFGYAFNHSFKLIKDNWWATFGTLIVIYIILIVASMVVTIPAMIINAGNIFTNLTKHKSVSITATIFAAILHQLSYILYIIPAVTVSLCYFNLTESKEGTGLIERINQFGNIKPDTNATPEEY